MKLWKRASGAIKDGNSLFKASLTRRSSLRNPDIEAAVIKATSHDESRVDYRNAQRVFAWIRVSNSYIRPVLWAVSYRMSRTRSWAVALKGLMLLHGVFCCKVPAVQKIGRLPFDLSNFKDGHSKHEKMWGFDLFIRAYYAFLDQKSSFIFLHSQEQKDLRIMRKGIEYGTMEKEKEKKSMMQDLVWLQKLQGLLDMLLQIKPQSPGMINVLVLEAMDCIVIEIFDIYSRICNGIASVLVRIYSANRTEAGIALSILQKATIQGEELTLYFEFCRDIGVINASECPKIEQIPEEDIRELELILKGVTNQPETKEMILKEEEKKAIVVVEKKKKTKKTHERNDSTGSLMTIITDDWEVFEEEQKKSNYELELISLLSPPPPAGMGKNNAKVNPFVDDQPSIQELPDLIIF